MTDSPYLSTTNLRGVVACFTPHSFVVIMDDRYIDDVFLPALAAELNPNITIPHLYAHYQSRFGQRPQDSNDVRTLINRLDPNFDHIQALSERQKEDYYRITCIFAQKSNPQNLEQFAVLSDEIASSRIWQRMREIMGLQAPEMETVTDICSWTQQYPERLRAIYNLNLSSLSLSLIPDWFVTLNLPNLQQIDFENNQLRTLPQDLGLTWTNLQRADFSHNQLQTLPENLGRTWTQLNGIYFQHNLLQQALPAQLGRSWDLLLQVDFRYNQLQTPLPAYLASKQR